MIYGTNATRKQITLKDGAELSYLELGEGRSRFTRTWPILKDRQWLSRVPSGSGCQRVHGKPQAGPCHSNGPLDGVFNSLGLLGPLWW